MTDKIINLQDYKKKLASDQEVNCSDILMEIAKQDPKNIFVITWGKDSSTTTYHSSTSDMPNVLLKLQTFIHKYFNGDFND